MMSRKVKIEFRSK